VIHLFLYVARKVDEAVNFVLVQLTEQVPGIIIIIIIIDGAVLSP
jgi:hypothetical protein